MLFIDGIKIGVWLAEVFEKVQMSSPTHGKTEASII
jgi:hypothetical protein